MIIFINGSINAGKTTVAKLLSEKIGNTANVEIDSLHEYIEWLAMDKAVPLNLENGVLIIKNFTKHGFNVVVPYPLSAKNYNYMKDALEEYKDQLYFFTLAPDITKAQTSTKDRTLTQWEVDRIQHHYDIGIPTPSFGHIIDSTNQTPEETTQEILHILNI